MFKNVLRTLSWLVVLLPAAASAQATRTWVSGIGDDANPCSRTRPARPSLAPFPRRQPMARSIVSIPGFGAVTITKSITLDCSGTFGSVLNSGVTAVNIQFDSFADTIRTVRLRGLTLNGAGASGARG